MSPSNPSPQISEPLWKRKRKECKGQRGWWTPTQGCLNQQSSYKLTGTEAVCTGLHRPAQV
ncbi:hypothetical protein LEMLEM_LOCUS16129, partial [Lemmus lemmus]